MRPAGAKGALRPGRAVVAAAIAVATAAAAGCGAATTMGYAAADNNPAQLSRALRRMRKPAALAPRNATGKPLVFLVTRAGAHRRLIAYDLAGRRVLWRTAAAVTSRIAVGRSFIAYRSGPRSVVVRDVATGKQRWKKEVDGDALLGVAADRQRVYCVVRRGAPGHHAGWRLLALRASDGSRRWYADAPGQLGTPAAQDGLVFSPFWKQWLAILDARTGKQLARIRGLDEEISFVRASGKHVFFGSRAGVFLLDRRAATGRRRTATYGRVPLPKSLSGLRYYWNGFDPVEVGYSAYDRHRVLWRAEREGDRLAFQGGRVVLHSDAFLFGIDARSGKLLWAHDSPSEVVASAQLGRVIGFASSRGEVGALDPATGRRLFRARLHADVVGATFDAAGWKPSPGAGAGKPADTERALVAIARDRDARFGEVKKYAVRALAKLPGVKVTRDLLSVIERKATSPGLRKAAADALAARKQASGAGALIDAAATRRNYIAGTVPRAVGAAARALGALARAGKLAPALRKRAIVALTGALEAPDTSPAALVAVIRALGALGGRSSAGALRSFLLIYRADPDFAADPGPLRACMRVLLDSGAPAARELVRYVAEDARTQHSVARAAARALASKRSHRPAGGAKKGAAVHPAN